MSDYVKWQDVRFSQTSTIIDKLNPVRHARFHKETMRFPVILSHTLTTLSTALCPAVQCLPISFSHVVNSSDVKPGAVINVTCPAGQVLTTRQTDAVIASCGVTGSWTPAIPDCIGS